MAGSGLMASEVSQEKIEGRLKIRLDARKIGTDLLIIITGGESHIGAVGAGTKSVSKLATSSVITLPGHRDDRIAKDAAEQISKKFGCNCAVIAGIHYDHISPEEIDKIVFMVDDLIEKLEEALRTA